MDWEGGASGTMSAPNDPTDDSGNAERPIIQTMNREKPYPIGMSRAEMDRRRQRSLTETSEFAFAPFSAEKPAQLEGVNSTRRDENHDPRRQAEPKQLYKSQESNYDLEEVRPSSKQLDDPFMIRICPPATLPFPSEGMGLIVYQPGQDSSRNLDDRLMNRTTEGVQSLPPPQGANSNPTRPASQQRLFDDPFMSVATAGGMISDPTAGGRNFFMTVVKPESSAESYSELFLQDITVHSSPEIQTPKSNGRPRSDEGAREDDSSSMDSDGYPLAIRTPSYMSSSGYRRRSSIGVGPHEESDLLREWSTKRRDELESKSIKSEESRRQILDIAQTEMKSFYAKCLTDQQIRKKINREKERVFNAVHNTGKDSKMPLNPWEVVVSMLPPAPTAERSKSSGNRTPSTSPATPQKLMSPSTFFSQHIPTVPPATPPTQGTTNPKRGKDVKKDTNPANTKEEVEIVPPVKVTDISRMRQILLKLKDKLPDFFKKEPEYL